LLFPIQWPEPFGLVMTEAMACGTPVVAWRNGSVPEVVADGETGFIVDPNLPAAHQVRSISALGRRQPREGRRYHAPPSQCRVVLTSTVDR
jgi:glycosyltransferase involved in cell wall biosynthesis